MKLFGFEFVPQGVHLFELFVSQEWLLDLFELFICFAEWYNIGAFLFNKTPKVIDIKGFFGCDTWMQSAPKIKERSVSIKVHLVSAFGFKVATFFVRLQQKKLQLFEEKCCGSTPFRAGKRFMFVSQQRGFSIVSVPWRHYPCVRPFPHVSNDSADG